MEEAVSRETSAVLGAASVHILAPVARVQLRDARLTAVHIALLGILHATKHDRVQRSGSAQKKIPLALAQRAQRAEHEQVLEFAHLVKRARLLLQSVVLAVRKIALCL